MTKRVLVTGSRGFIGSHLVERLRELGWSVVEVDLKIGSNVLDFKSQERFDVVFHLAGLISVPESMEKPVDYLVNNVVGTKRLLENVSFDRFVFASSSSAGFESTVYGLSKLFGEWLMPSTSVCLRFTNVFGEGQVDGHVFPGMLKRILGGESPIIFGDGSQRRDYVYVKDLVEELILFADNSVCGVFDVGYGRNYSTLEICNLLLRECGSDLEPVFVSERRGDVDFTLSSRRIGGVYGFELGVRRTVEWAKRHFV